MADIFISYATADRPFARRLADVLEARGWSVWWDHRSLHGGQHFDRVIEEAICGARVVIVVWSKTSVESGWVRDEATLALEEQKLVPLRIDMIRLPMRFRNIHTIDLSSWIGETEAEPFERLLKDLSHYLGPAATTQPTPTTEPPPSIGRKRGSKYFAAVVVTGGVLWGVVFLVERQQPPNNPSMDPTVSRSMDPKLPDSIEDSSAAKAAYDRGDYTTALSLARPAAERGDRVAQYILGTLYRDGKGVTQEYAEAMRWYRKAADQGNADAQNNLGWLYRDGLGVPRDYAEAMHWYRKAADQGNAGAQFYLGSLYYSGSGVPQDMAQSQAWMQKAAAAGDEDAKKWLAKN